MTQDYQSPKLPVFTGINDVPRLATASLAENGSALTDRVNRLFDSLDTDINDLDSRVSSLEGGGGSPSQNVIFNSTGLNDFNNWFNNSPNGIAYLVVMWIPDILPLWTYNTNFGIYQPIDLNSLDKQFNSNVFLILDTEDFITIDQADLPQANFDLSDFFLRGKGLYVFMFYDVDSGGYGSSVNLPSNSSIIINTSTAPKGIEVVDIYRDDKWNIPSNNIERLYDSSTQNQEYSVNTFGKVQALKLNDPNDFDITFTLAAS